MKNPIVIGTLLVLIASCSHHKEHVPIEASLQKINTSEISIKGQSEKQIHSCLDNEAHFIAQQPNTLKDFATTLGYAIVKCQATRTQLKEYVDQVLKKHGDFH
ncbi:MAG: hypothetical protein KC505_10745 [Myxococcales bacterium]|nr:hypothetical protein [Myxococcales bacterium]USN50043.1 MAG: hypothetical protein H6731_07150 [Myxococcales bacterium]